MPNLVFPPREFYAYSSCSSENKLGTRHSRQTAQFKVELLKIYQHWRAKDALNGWLSISKGCGWKVTVLWSPVSKPRASPPLSFPLITNVLSSSCSSINFFVPLESFSFPHALGPLGPNVDQAECHYHPLSACRVPGIVLGTKAWSHLILITTVKGECQFTDGESKAQTKSISNSHN